MAARIEIRNAATSFFTALHAPETALGTGETRVATINLILALPLFLKENPGHLLFPSMVAIHASSLAAK